jgi:hypothetical protein
MMWKHGTAVISMAMRIKNTTVTMMVRKMKRHVISMRRMRMTRRMRMRRMVKKVG